MELGTTRKVKKSIKEQHKIVTFMTDIKCHSLNKQRLKLITEELKRNFGRSWSTLKLCKSGVFISEGINE